MYQEKGETEQENYAETWKNVPRHHSQQKEENNKKY